MMFLARWAAMLAVLCGGVALPCQAAPGLMESLDQAVCRTIERSAQAAHLPVDFVTRVIWRESSFRPRVISRAGAEGIAQFMPSTAVARGLADPFDPEQAIPKAARFLADLRRRFGNLGIAAAAYNAGEARVSNWLRGQGGLPNETRAYVRFVTGRDAEEWIGSGSSNAAGAPMTVEAAEPQSCLVVTAELRRGGGGGRGGRDLGAVGRAARRQFLEGLGARRVRPGAGALCRGGRRHQADDHWAIIAQPRHPTV